jgi:hypothetical protein
MAVSPPDDLYLADDRRRKKIHRQNQFLASNGKRAWLSLNVTMRAL